MWTVPPLLSFLKVFYLVQFCLSLHGGEMEIHSSDSGMVTAQGEYGFKDGSNLSFCVEMAGNVD